MRAGQQELVVILCVAVMVWFSISVLCIDVHRCSATPRCTWSVQFARVICLASAVPCPLGFAWCSDGFGRTPTQRLNTSSRKRPRLGSPSTLASSNARGHHGLPCSLMVCGQRLCGVWTGPSSSCAADRVPYTGGGGGDAVRIFPHFPHFVFAFSGQVP